MSVPEAPDEVPADARRAIVAQYRELEGETFSVAGKGWHSLAVDVGGRLIFKFPQGEEAEAALRREARLLDAAGPHLTMAVPSLTLYEGPPLFSVHAKLAGGVLEREAYGFLDEAAKEAVAGDLALFFGELHAIDPGLMRAAGAEAIAEWETGDSELARIWDRLPQECAAQAREALHAFRAMSPDPLGIRYGFFDGHGWNMAFDGRNGRLAGIFDFADSGFGPVHREFAPVSLISPDLTARTIRAYELYTGKTIHRRRIFLLTAAMRLSEFAGAIATGENEEWIRDLVVDWFAQRDCR